MKQNIAAYFTDYADALRTTGHKYFGHTHNGIFDNAQFSKDFSLALNEKHPVSNSIADKLLVRVWNSKKETLTDYMNQVGISENVAPYVLEAQNYVYSAIDPSKVDSKDNPMPQIVANIIAGMDKIESKVEQDKSLTESEIVSVLIATTMAKNVTGAISDVVTDFFTNLNTSYGRNQASLRGFWSFIRAVINVVATAVVTYYVTSVERLGYIARTLYGAATGNGDFIDALADAFTVGFGHYNELYGIIEGNYTCYFPEDSWNCPR